MPELPEVESIRGQLDKYLRGHKIQKVSVHTPKIVSGDVNKLVGGKVKKVRRFGKVLSVDLDNSYSFVAHIKLTGQFIYRGPNLKDPPDLSKKVIGGLGGRHTHLIFHLDRDGKLFYNDVRRFGWIKIVETESVTDIDFIKKLGPEPLNGLTLELFSKILKSSKSAVKIVIMDQSKMGGVGNIYANDALWLASINPTRPANSLKESEVKLLYNSIIRVLKEGIKRGGASELAFVTPDGGEGNYQNYFLAYGKEGKFCSRCKKAKFIKIMLGGRGTYFCPNCQRQKTSDR